MNPDQIFVAFQTFPIIKIVFLFISAFYTGFLFIVLKQLNSMGRIFTDKISSQTLKTVAILNIMASLALLLTALVIL